MTSPYLLPNPSVISFSGGRTSGFMLKMIVDAFGGVLPDWVKVVFCNTGKEREETLCFVERCSQRWDVPIVWLEYRWEPGRKFFAHVDFASASRDGDPFKLLIQSRKMLPNPVMRFCTYDMKIMTTNRYVRRELGWDAYTNAVGFRRDEPNRVRDILSEPKCTATVMTLFGEEEEEIDGRDPIPGETPCCPLFDAGVTKPMILEWWARQDFNLDLAEGEGNCDLCFLKGAGTLIELMKRRPESSEWWRERERERELSDYVQTSRKRKFALFNDKRPSYAELSEIAKGNIAGPGWLFQDTKNGSCGELSECRCTD